MFRFVHTSDWQLGLSAAGLGEAGGKVRQARLDALANIFRVAGDQRADAILVAGDLFENNHVDPRLIEQALAILQSIAWKTRKERMKHE